MQGIYCILNTANGHRYVGQSTDLSRRKSYHFTALFKGTHKNKHLQAAYNRYGASCFQWLILQVVCGTSSLDTAERHWIAFYASNDPRHGYNAEPGGLTRPRASCRTRWAMQRAQGIRRSKDKHDVKS